MFKKELNRNVTQKRIYMWNALGSLSNAASSVILLVVLTRILGTVQGGIFSISFALAQQMATVASFETGTYQVTDGKNVFPFKTYFTASILLYVFSTLLATAKCIISSYSLLKTSIVILICLYRGLDAFNNTCSAAMQKKGRLDIGGKSFALRIIGSTVIFIAVAYLSKSLLISTVSLVVFSALWVVFYEFKFVSFFEKIAIDFSFKRIFKLLIECLPMFLGVFLMTYVTNQPKYAIDSVLLDETQNALFGIVFMPSAVVNLLSLLMYRPLLTGLTSLWINANYKTFLKRIMFVAMLIFSVILLCIAAAFVCGIPVLSFVYGVDLNGCKTALCLAIGGGGFYAYASLIYNAIVILRKQRLMIIGYVSAAICAFITAPVFVKTAGLTGGAFSYLVSCFLLACVLTVIFFVLYFIQKKKGDIKNET